MKSARLIMLLAVLLGASSVMGASRVTNVLLSHEPGQTVAHIDVEGEVRFAHQAEIAKDGKPNRVIVDILSATHQLGCKDFHDVPECIVQAVRTSQYSVQPEKTVRIVFDMDHETVYQIVASGQQVKVSFPDPKARAFAEWSTRQVVMAMLNAPEKKSEVVVAHKPSRSAVDLNITLDSDRMASLADGNKAQAAPVKTPPPAKQAVAKAAPAPVKSPLPEVPTGSARKYSDRSQFEVEAPVAVAKPAQQKVVAPVEQPAPVKSKTLAAQPIKPAVSKPLVVLENAATPQADKEAAPQKTVKQSQPVSSKPLVVLENAATPQAEKKAAPQKTVKQSKPVSSKPLVVLDEPLTPQPKEKAPATEKTPTESSAKTEGNESLAKVEQSEEEPTDTPQKSKSTARFRRSPVESNKAKGTMVAEFPQRLVIQYASKGYRDPFETLINEARVFDSPMAERVPNIDGLKLVGVIASSGDENSALFEDSDSYSYILRAGDKVRKGYVLRVEQDRVFFQIFEYGWSRTVALNIED